MKWLTYSRQMTLGIIAVTVGHALSWITGYGRFQNLGWIIYGLLFLIHPVWLESSNTNPHIKTYVRITGAVVVLVGCMIRVGGEDDFWQKRISESLGIDASQGTVDTGYDDHSGFHGDGTMYVELSFQDDNLETLISAPGGWHRLPLTDNLETLIYGTRTESKATGPFIGITMSRAKNGFWYFYDRQGKTTDDSGVLNRSSFNYTFALYDAEKDRLYYCEYDT